MRKKASEVTKTKATEAIMGGIFDIKGKMQLGTWEEKRKNITANPLRRLPWDWGKEKAQRHPTEG